MRLTPARQAESALTRLELTVVVACLALFVLLLLPMVVGRPERPVRRSARLQCVQNLKLVGVATRIFQADSPYPPWGISTNEGGSAEFTEDALSTWRHFAVMSNELGNPKVLWCPSDVERTHAQKFGTNGPGVQLGNNRQASYFVGLGSMDEIPASIRSGDRNVTTNGVEVFDARLWVSNTNIAMGFSALMHKFEGNLLFGDGSVQQETPAGFREAVKNAAGALLSADVTNNAWLVP